MSGRVLMRCWQGLFGLPVLGRIFSVLVPHDDHPLSLVSVFSLSLLRGRGGHRQIRELASEPSHPPANLLLTTCSLLSKLPTYTNLIFRRCHICSKECALHTSGAANVAMGGSQSPSLYSLFCINQKPEAKTCRPGRHVEAVPHATTRLRNFESHVQNTATTFDLQARLRSVAHHRARMIPDGSEVLEDSNVKRLR